MNNAQQPHARDTVNGARDAHRYMNGGIGKHG